MDEAYGAVCREMDMDEIDKHPLANRKSIYWYTAKRLSTFS